MKKYLIVILPLLFLCSCTAEPGELAEIQHELPANMDSFAKATGEMAQNQFAYPDMNSNNMPHEEPLVYYGELTPTLYRSMPEEQQNSVVALWHKTLNYSFCSAALISPHVVLTAAHCILSETLKGSMETALTPPETIEVRIGQNNKTPDKKLQVKEIKYLDYIKTGYQNDVALLILEEPDYTTTKIDIQSGSIQAAFGQKVQAVGYGVTESTSTVNGYNNSLRHWTSIDCLGYGYNSQIHLYGYKKTGVSPGDSGSPLLFDFGEGVRIIGVASTNHKDCVEDAFYTPIDQHERWIRNIVNQYDNLACVETCSQNECGIVDGCSCGICGHGMECNANHQCVKKDPGSGGICISSYPSTKECLNDGDCPDGKHCLIFGEATTCVAVSYCRPAACSKVDKNSVCMSIWLDSPTNYGLCMEHGIAQCSQAELGEACVTLDNDIGQCMKDSNGNPRCYKGCRTVDTCKEKEFCLPFNCYNICQERECGEVAGCECGKCASFEVCQNGTCIDPDEQGQPETECACNVDANCNADCDCDPDCSAASSSTNNKSGKKGCNGGGSASLAVLFLCSLWLRNKNK